MERIVAAIETDLGMALIGLLTLTVVIMSVG